MNEQPKRTAFRPANPDFESRVRDSFARQPMMDHIGAELTVVAPGYCEIDMPYLRSLTQQHGYIHGGAMATIADSAAGYAAFTLAPADHSILTVEYKLNLVRPGEGKRFIAKGVVVKPGKILTVVNADVYAVREGKEVLCVTSIQTLMSLAGQTDDAHRATVRS